MKRVTVLLLAVCSCVLLFGENQSDCLSAARKRAQILLEKGYSLSGRATDVKDIVEGIVSSLEACGFTEEELKALRALQAKIGHEVDARARNNEMLPTSYYTAEIEKQLTALGKASKTSKNIGTDSPKISVPENEVGGGAPHQELSPSFPVDGFIVKEKLDLSENMSLMETRKIRTDLETLERRMVNLSAVSHSYQVAYITMVVVLTAVTAIVVILLFMVNGLRKRTEHLVLRLHKLDKTVGKS